MPSSRASAEEVERRAAALMEELGCAVLGVSLQARGWTFAFDRARVRLGACHPARKQITLSAWLAARMEAAEVEETLRHEVAHALDVEQRGYTSHDATWKALAVRCGARPCRTTAGGRPADPDAPYTATCPACARVHPLYRQPVQARRCGPCDAAGSRVYLRVAQRETGHLVWAGGATPGRYGGDAGFEAQCPGCGRVSRRAQRPRRAMACGPCCRQHADGRYRRAYRLVFTPVRASPRPRRGA